MVRSIRLVVREALLLLCMVQSAAALAAHDGKAGGETAARTGVPGDAGIAPQSRQNATVGGSDADDGARPGPLRDLIIALARSRRTIQVTGQFVHDDGLDLRGYLLTADGVAAVRMRPLDVDVAGSAPADGIDADPGSLQPLFFPADGLLNGDEFYELLACEPRQIAGRLGSCVRVSPRDRHRPGYSLWIDARDGVLLGMSVHGQRGETLERMQFLQIETVPVAGSVPGDPQPDESRSRSPSSGASVPASAAWLPNWVPGGFGLEDAEESPTGSSARYTDGVAAFSVFMTPLPGGDAVRKNGQTLPGESVSSRGATVIVEQHLSRPGGADSRVAVVGELPVPTARRILLGMRPEP